MPTLETGPLTTSLEQLAAWQNILKDLLTAREMVAENSPKPRYELTKASSAQAAALIVYNAHGKQVARVASNQPQVALPQPLLDLLDDAVTRQGKLIADLQQELSEALLNAAVELRK